MNHQLKIISTKLSVVLDLIVRPFFGKEILIAENNCWDELEYYWNLKEDYESKKVLHNRRC